MKKENTLFYWIGHLLISEGFEEFESLVEFVLGFVVVVASGVCCWDDSF